MKTTAKFLPLQNLPAWLPLGLAGAAATAILRHWIQLASHGFEFTDEGLYLLAAENPWRNVHSSLFGFGLHPVYLLAGGDLGRFRILALAGVLAAGAVLAMAWLRSRGGPLAKGPAAWAVTAVILSGCLLVFSNGRRTPGYDTLVFLGAVLGWAGYFFLTGPGGKRLPAWVLLASGILICALGKWAVALLLTGLWTGLLVLAGKKSGREWLSFAGILLAGAAGLLAWIGLDAWGRAWNEAGFIVREMRTHGIQLIPLYGLTMLNFFYRTLRAFLYGAPVLLVLLWISRRRPQWIPALGSTVGWWVWLILVFGISLGLTKAGFHGFSRVGSNVAAELLWLACAAGILRGTWRVSDSRWGELLGLLATPVLLGVGTATALGDYVGHGAVFFQIVGLGIWARWSQTGLPPSGALPFLAVTALLNLARAEISLRDQFRTPEVASCRSSWQRPDGRTLFLHEGQRELLAGLQDKLGRLGFRPGDPILAIGDLPGVVYLLGGWSPGTSWYFAYQLKSHRYVEAVLGAVPEPVRRGSFLLFRENSPLWKGRREPILALAGRPESPVEEIGPVHFEEMTTRIFIWAPAEPLP